MFQSSDDVDFDENLLMDCFDSLPELNNESNTKSDCQPPVKKLCTAPLAESMQSARNMMAPLTHSLFKHRAPPRLQRVVERKFPGPAGILSMDDPLEDEIVCSQSTVADFQKGPWQQMLSDIPETLHGSYTIEWIKLYRTYAHENFPRTPFLAAVVVSINCSTQNPSIVLKDNTGEIHATICNEFWDKFEDFLHPGSVIVLKHIGVIAIRHRSSLRPHLNVTLNNLITIYSYNEQSETTVVKIQDICYQDFIQAIHDEKVPRLRHLCNSNKPKTDENRICSNTHLDNPSELSEFLVGVDTNALFDDF